jgi:site-specific DNA recombinase
MYLKYEQAQSFSNRPRMTTREFIERVQLVPDNGVLKIELYGELAALLKLGTEPKKRLQAESEGVQITMVAGAGFEPATFRL